jgi:hypothetical protein
MCFIVNIYDWIKFKESESMMFSNVTKKHKMLMKSFTYANTLNVDMISHGNIVFW